MKTYERPQYITQLNAFHRWLYTNHLPPKAKLLWFMLIGLFNTAGWPEWIQVDARHIMQWIGAGNEKTAYRARDALVRAGLLEYRRGHKGCPNRYRMCWFPNDPREACDGDYDGDYDGDCDGDCDGGCGSQNVANDGDI